MSSLSSAPQLNTSVPSLITPKSSFFSLKNKKMITGLSVGLLVVLGLIYYFVIRPKMSEGYQGSQSSKLILYWASWCGHSKSFKPVWDDFSKK